jgi:nitrogen regulatory protein PII
MKLITAIIQPFMVDKLARVIRKQPISGYTISKVGGSGRDLESSPAEYMRPRNKFEIAVNDHQVQELIDLIVHTVSTHQEGDGIIFVTTIDAVVNIQTAEKDEAALAVQR